MANEEPAYSTSPGRLSPLLKKIRDTGIPSEAKTPWLKTMGFTGGNDTSMLRVLRYIGLTDASGVPTPAWQEYRGNDHRAVLGRAIKTGYKSLYAVYPDAHNQADEDLEHVFKTSTTSGKTVVDKMLATFKALAAEADFTDDAPGASASSGQGQTVPASAAQAVTAQSPTVVAAAPATTTNGLTVNINVQLTLPEGSDEQTFEAFFKAMKTHLFPDPE